MFFGEQLFTWYVDPHFCDLVEFGLLLVDAQKNFDVDDVVIEQLQFIDLFVDEIDEFLIGCKPDCVDLNFHDINFYGPSGEPVSISLIIEQTNCGYKPE